MKLSQAKRNRAIKKCTLFEWERKDKRGRESNERRERKAPTQTGEKRGEARVVDEEKEILTRRTDRSSDYRLLLSE